jgi:hypothetical protein
MGMVKPDFISLPAKPTPAMKHILAAFCLILILHPDLKAQKTWKASDYKPESYRKVMVLARLNEGAARRQLEDFTVKFMNDKGIVAIPAYANLKKTDGMSREEFLVIADSLQVDALLVYSLNGAVKRAETTGTVSVGVGVGMYGGYASTSVPVATNTKWVADVKLSVYFYNRASLDEQWAWQLSGTVDGSTDKLAYEFAKNTVKAMIKDGMFLPKK